MSAPGTGVVVGVDLATANVRLAVVDIETGERLAGETAALPAPRRDDAGASEQDPCYWPVTAQLLGRAAERYGSRVRAICVTGTSGSVVPTDAAGRPVGRGLLYDDTRRPACLPGPLPARQATLGRIAWLAAHRPGSRYLHTADIVTAALAGRVLATDTSHALKSGIDPLARTWPAGELEHIGVQLAQLPDLVHPGTTLGLIGRESVQDLGLPADLRIIAGMTDGCTAQLATGAVAPYDAVGTLGTTLVLKLVTPRPVEEGALYSHLAPDGRYWTGAASNIGAAAFTSLFPATTDQLTEWNALAWAHGPAGVVRYPLVGVGDRFPVAVPEARGFLLGRPRSEIDAYRATLEGVAFIERLGTEKLSSRGLDIERYLLAGGASRSPELNRIRASVLGRAVQVPEHQDSAYGAATLAAAAICQEPLAETARRLSGPCLDVPADRDLAEAMQPAYERLVAALAERGWLAS